MSRLSCCVPFAASLLMAATSSEAVVLEFQSVRRTVNPHVPGAGVVTETFSQTGFPGIPSLTQNSVYNDGRYRSTGETSGGVTDSLNGRYEVGFFQGRSDGIGLFAGYSGTFATDAWTGGTGNYAGASSMNAFAGYSKPGSGFSENNTSDFGYTVAPLIGTPAYVKADISPPGQPGPDASDFTNIALGYRDVSFSLRDQTYTYGLGGTITGLPAIGFGGFDTQTHVFDATSGPATFEWTGAGGNRMGGTIHFLDMPFGTETIPVPDDGSGNARGLSHGYYLVTGGRVGDLLITGGTIAFALANTYPVGAASGSGTIDLDAYGWVETQPVPEPSTWAMLVTGALVVGVGVRRARSATRQRANAGVRSEACDDMWSES